MGLPVCACRQKPLQELLELLVEEGDPALPPWFLPVDLLAQHLAACPSRDKLIGALRARGYAATRCHVEVGLAAGVGGK
jgi:tRNA G26 N,N-dimethylase Trm1